MDKDSSVSIHRRNIQILAIEMDKVKNGSSPEIMIKIFQLKGDNYYNPRQVSKFIGLHVNSVLFEFTYVLIDFLAAS